ncbi:MAG: polysaccharide deacetylase family protein [Chloroflexota bacterium]
MQPNPVLKKLGLSNDDRVAIIHVDDVGMCQATIAAFADLHDFGLVSSGAVMVPCPWFLEAARFAREHPDADIGVHLTLNSEWETYRWGPVSTRDPQTGLLDAQGFFHRQSAQTQAHADPEAVARELEAQVQRAIESGVIPTHADTHMGTVAHMKFMQSYIQLALKYKVPPMMLRLDEAGWRMVAGQHRGVALDESAVALAAQIVHTLEDMGVPLLDSISHLSLEADPATRLDQAKCAFDGLKPGITHFIIHAAKDTPELRALAPDWACRAADYETFMNEELRQHIQRTGLHVIGYRAIQSVMGSA